MSELSYLWSAPAGAGDGASSFTRTDWSNIMRVIAACFASEGVAAGYLNGLAGSTTGANNARIASGGAIVDGKPYYSSAAVDVTIPSAAGGGNTRIDRVVLRADWAGQTVRVTRIVGIDAASPTAPTITQVSGTTYDVLLYKATVNTSGTVTMTDERTFAIPTSAVINTAAITDLAVTTGKMALNSVDDTIAGDRVPQFYRRQGGDSANWAVAGSSSRTPTSVRMQAGSITAGSIAGLSTASVTITFPVAFSQVPLVFAICIGSGGGNIAVTQISSTIVTSTTQMGVDLYNLSAGTETFTIHWLAIGSE